jgi:hypothetical protein
VLLRLPAALRAAQARARVALRPGEPLLEAQLLEGLPPAGRLLAARLQRSVAPLRPPPQRQRRSQGSPS